MPAKRAAPTRKKSAREKLARVHPSHGVPFIVPDAMCASAGIAIGSTMIVPRPLDVEAAMGAVRKGKLQTLGRIRMNLAHAAGVALTCPLTTGIFARLTAEAAEEDAAAGKKRITPYWRTIRDDGSLIDKFPGGPAAQARRLRAEGFSILPSRGKKPGKVKDFEKHMMS